MQSSLPASAIFLKSFSLKYPICQCAVFEGSVFQTLSSAMPVPTCRESMASVLPFYLFIFGCAGSSPLLGPSLVTAVGTTLWWSCRGFSLPWLLLLWNAGPRCTGCRSGSMWAQELWLMGLVAPSYVKSSWTGHWTHVPCTGRQIPIQGKSSLFLPNTADHWCCHHWLHPRNSLIPKFGISGRDDFFPPIPVATRWTVFKGNFTCKPGES